MTFRQARVLFQVRAAAGDGLLGVAACIAALEIHSSVLFRVISGPAPEPFSIGGNILCVVAFFICPMAVFCVKGYDFHIARGNLKLFLLGLGGAAIAAVAIVLVASLVSQRLVPGFFGTIFVAFYAALWFAGRVMYWQPRSPLEAWPEEFQNVVILGSGRRARGLAADLGSSRGERGCKLLGFLDDEPLPEDRRELGELLLGPLKNLDTIASHQVVDQVIFALPRRYLAARSTLQALEVCEAIGIDFTVAGDFFDTRLARPLLDELLGVPAVTFTTRHHHPSWALTVKRGVDILGALAALAVSVPLWPLVALAIKLDSKGPVFFIQNRVGLRGREFRFQKFRTMYSDAEDRREELGSQNEMTGPVFKMKQDPRVTRVGRILRRLSIDEMPQFLHVLFGQMSLVGPRPPIPSEVGFYEVRQRRRLSMRPGLTCLWQVQGRSEVQFEEWVRLDLEYIDRWSLWLDAKILLRTLPAVLGGRGAS